LQPVLSGLIEIFGKITFGKLRTFFGRKSMAIVSRAERKRRRCDALQRLTSGMGVSEVTRTLVRDYGITRRSANLDINWASAQMIKNLEKYENTDLMAWLITQTERVYFKALESNQLSAAIGSLNLLHKITLEASDKKRQQPFHGNYKH
tara:strand:+ start:24 stop:470 length:447 start_codon:yes stop_codon:yes gene_type:complete